MSSPRSWTTAGTSGGQRARQWRRDAVSSHAACMTPHHASHRRASGVLAAPATRPADGSSPATRPADGSSPATRPADGRSPACGFGPTNAAAAAQAPKGIARSSMLRSLASGALLLAAASAQAPAAAAATASADGVAEQATVSGRGGVAAVAAIASGKGAAAGLQQLGSGLVWDVQGHVVVPYAPLMRVQRQGTAGDAQVFVTLAAADGSLHELQADIVARDPSHELIVLQIQPPAAGLRPITLGSSARLRVGQDAILLGALPTGDPIVAAGVVSAVGRVIPASNNQALPGVLQTDADVNANTLGGALLDSGGCVIGMPVVSYSSKASFRSTGVNFALPADLLREVVPQLILYRSAAARR